MPMDPVIQEGTVADAVASGTNSPGTSNLAGCR